jgi:hypothetical protein
MAKNPASCGVFFRRLWLRHEARYFMCMKTPSHRNRTIGAVLSLALIAAAPVYAVETNRPVTILSPGELQNLNNRERRLDYQQRQQINRELDSQAIRRQRQRLEVPVIKPRCPLQTSGTARTC